MEKKVRNYLKQQMNGYSVVYIQDIASDFKITLDEMKNILNRIDEVEVIDDIIQIVYK